MNKNETKRAEKNKKLIDKAWSDILGAIEKGMIPKGTVKNAFDSYDKVVGEIDEKYGLVAVFFYLTILHLIILGMLLSC